MLAGHAGTSRSDHPLFPGLSFHAVLAGTYAYLSESRDQEQQRKLDEALGFEFDEDDEDEVLDSHTYTPTDPSALALLNRFGDLDQTPITTNDEG